MKDADAQSKAIQAGVDKQVEDAQKQIDDATN
jgi:hypothetical protein